jgi:hypothetical protein
VWWTGSGWCCWIPLPSFYENNDSTFSFSQIILLLGPTYTTSSPAFGAFGDPFSQRMHVAALQHARRPGYSHSVDIDRQRRMTEMVELGVSTPFASRHPMRFVVMHRQTSLCPPVPRPGKSLLAIDQTPSCPGHVPGLRSKCCAGWSAYLLAPYLSHSNVGTMWAWPTYQHA